MISRRLNFFWRFICGKRRKFHYVNAKEISVQMYMEGMETKQKIAEIAL